MAAPKAIDTRTPREGLRLSRSSADLVPSTWNTRSALYLTVVI